jgi:hypothetical protein
MGKESGIQRTLMLLATGWIFMAILCLPARVLAQDEATELKEKLEQMDKEMKEIQEKLDQLQTDSAKQKDLAKEQDQRLNKAELHTATDKLSFGVDFRTRGDSIHYTDTRVAPSALLNNFFIDFNPTPPPMGGFNGATREQIQQMLSGMAQGGMIPAPDKVDVDNDVIFTNRLRLDMKAKVNSQLSFTGRLAANKVYGDSSGVKFNQGSLGDVTFDGNTSSLPHGDTIRMERAYFNYTNDIGPVPINFSLGRRPSTEGPPLEYKNNSLEGGSPMATIINWQFDGASLTFGLEDVTGIPGSAFKLCYGVGFEGDWGNSSSLASSQPDVDDVHMFGFIADLYDNDITKLELNYAHAWDITDGFTGLTVMPFIVSKQDTNGDGTPEYYFQPNSGAFVSRIEPSTNIGDWDAASLLFQTNFAEWFADIDFFIAGSYTHTDPSRVSQNPFYEILGQGLLSSNGELEERDGYGIYAGVIFPMPLSAKLGLEYNWGSKYWFNFTGAEDSLVGSKLAVRGQVYEAYYHQPIFGPNFFVTLGGQYYDYEYTGSGNPLGEPVKISDATALDTLNAVVDEVWVGYLSATLRF